MKVILRLEVNENIRSLLSTSQINKINLVKIREENGEQRKGILNSLLLIKLPCDVS